MHENLDAVMHTTKAAASVQLCVGNLVFDDKNGTRTPCSYAHASPVLRCVLYLVLRYADGGLVFYFFGALCEVESRNTFSAAGVSGGDVSNEARL